MSTTFIESQTLTTEVCCHAQCHVVFAMPLSWQEHYKKTHEFFCCPAGHRQHYTVETEEERLRRNVAQLQTTIEHKDAALVSVRRENTQLVHQRRGLKGALKRVKTRIQAGVCPDCNRTFQNLARHMACKHMKK